MRNIMLKRQKQCQHEEIHYPYYNKNKQTKPNTKLRNRQIIQQLSQNKVKIIQINSDNYHDRKTIADKKLKSFQIVPKQQRHQIIMDQYQMGQKKNQYKKNSNNFSSQKQKLYQRDNTSSSSKNNIITHYQQSKSRYKNAKEKAKRLIQKMLHSSKNNEKELQIQMNKKIDQVKTHINQRNINTNQYMTQINKVRNSSLNAKYKPKIQKCTSLTRRNSKQKNNSLSKFNFTGNLYNNHLNIKKTNPSQKQDNHSRILFQQESKVTNENPLVLKQKHLFTQYYGFNEFKPTTQKQIKDVSQTNCKQLTLQFPISKKQSLKIINRARQKNKKIVGKLKQRKSFLRNSIRHSIRNGMNFNRLSKLGTGDLQNSMNTTLNLTHNFSQKQSFYNRKLSDNDKSFIDSQQNFLSINSNLASPSIICSFQQIRQKILLHLQMLNIIADYVKSFNNIYQDCNQWQQLIFLLYKKYYIQRYKIYNILKSSNVKFHDGSIDKQSPFKFDFCLLQIQQLDYFRQTKQQISFQLQLETDNISIKSALRQLYNKFIQKTQDCSFMNMYQNDDFTQYIIQDLNEEINLLIQSCGKSNKIKKRINQAIQVGLMLAHLEGFKFDQIQQIITGDIQSMKYYSKFYPLFMEIFQEQNKSQYQ